MQKVFYALSPTLAIAFASFALAFATSFAARPYGFATLSNACFITSALWREAAAARGRSTSGVAGELSGGSFPLLLIGASSLAFHRQPELQSQEHTLDIFSGWLLVLHLCFCSASVAVLSMPMLLGWQTPSYAGWRWLFSASFVGAVMALAALMETIYDNQLQFYFSVVLWQRCLARFADGSWQMARVVSALRCSSCWSHRRQSQVPSCPRRVGRSEFTLDTTPEVYDLFHGCWHVLLGTVAAVVYARRRRIAPRGRGLCALRMWHSPDWIGEIILLLLAVSALVLKEAEVDLIVAQAIIGGCAGLGLLHAGNTSRVSGPFFRQGRLSRGDVSVTNNFASYRVNGGSGAGFGGSNGKLELQEAGDAGDGRTRAGRLRGRQVPTGCYQCQASCDSKNNRSNAAAAKGLRRRRGRRHPRRPRERWWRFVPRDGVWRQGRNGGRGRGSILHHNVATASLALPDTHALIQVCRRVRD